MNACENAKDAAALGALELIRDLNVSLERVGIGTGSTVSYFVKRSRNLLDHYSIVYPSSRASMLMLMEQGFIVGDPGSFDNVSVYIDGADEVDSVGNLIKGRGAALLGEKLIAIRSRLNIIIVDESKIVNKLGSKKPVPIEIVPDALPYVLKELERQGLNPRIREGSGRDGPIISDWGGVIVDLYTGPLEDPVELHNRLKLMSGVIETGLFIGLTDYVVIGSNDCSWRVMRFERYANRY